MKNAKRFWALFLALAMTLAMFPATVFANDDEGYDEGYDNVSISFNEPGVNTLYSDGEYDLTFDTEGDLTDYTVVYSVGVGANTENESEGPYFPYLKKLTSGWSELDGGNGVRIDGAALWTAAKNSGIDPENDFEYELYVVGEIIDENNERETYEYAYFHLEESREIVEYEGGDIQLYLRESCSLSNEGTVIRYSAQYSEDDREINVPVEEITVKDKTIAKAYRDDDGNWAMDGLKSGKTTATVTMIDADNNEYIAETTIVVNRFRVELETESGKSIYLPGSTDVLIATVSGEDDSLPSDAKCIWTYRFESEENGDNAEVNITPDNNVKNKAVLTIGKMFAPYNANFTVSLTIKDSKNDVIGEGECGLSVYKEIYELSVSGIGEELDVDDSCEIECTLLRKTQDNLDGEEIPDATFEIEEENLSVEPVEGFSNRFTVTRLSSDWASLSVTAYVDGESIQSKFLSFDYIDSDMSFAEHDYDCFSDRDITLSVESDRLSKEGYSLEFSTYINPEDQQELEEGLSNCTRLDNSQEKKYYTENGNTVTLHTALLQEELDNYPNGEIIVLAELKRGAKTIDSCSTRIHLSKSEIIYFPDGQSKDILRGGYYQIYKESEGYMTDSDNPYGTEFQFVVTNVKKTDPSDDNFIVRYNKYMDAWEVTSNEVGTYSVEVTHTLKDSDETITETVEVSVVDEIAVIYDIEKEIDREFASFLPTEKIPFSVDGQIVKAVWDDDEKCYTEEVITKGISYKWVFVDTGTAENDYAVIENPNSKKPTVCIKSDIPEEVLENGAEFYLKAIMYFEGEPKKEREYDSAITVSNSFEEIASAQMNSYLSPKVKTKYNPVYYRYVFSDGQIQKKQQDVKFIIDYDVDEFTITDSKGKSIASYPDETALKGPFYVTRLTDDHCYFSIRDENNYYCTGSSFLPVISLSKAKVSGIKDRVYNGKAQTQSVSVKSIIDGQWETLNKNNYKVSYKNNKAVGKATVVITGVGEFYGSKTLSFQIKPKGTSLKKLTKGKKSFTATWTKQATQTTGYQIQYGLKKNFKGAKTVTVKKNKTTKTTVKKLKAKKKYYVRIRTYKQIGKTKYYSAWSKVKTVKTK